MGEHALAVFEMMGDDPAVEGTYHPILDSKTIHQAI